VSRQRPQLFGKTLFVDLMMSTLIVITSLLMASNAVEKAQKAKLEANLKTDGLYAIVVEWPDASADDVDLYVRDPRGRIVYFAARDIGLSHLEHDDQGTVSDRSQGGGTEPAVLRNEERVIVRGIFPGEFTVNVHMFGKRSPAPTEVKIVLYRLRGEDEVLVTKHCMLSKDGDEETAFRFTMDAVGSVTDINELSQQLVRHTPRGGQ
jgi:hypothetical protein